MSQGNDADTQAFLHDIEQRRGGSITYRTFSTFYADSDRNLCDFGVFFYQVGDDFWFEDFEHEPSFLGFKIRTRKETPKYEKFESTFSPFDVVSSRPVQKKKVRSFAVNGKDFSKLKNANILSRLFSEIVTELKLKDGKTMYFQFMDRTVLKMIDQIKGRGPKEGD